MDCDAFFMDPARTIDSVIAMYSPLVSKTLSFELPNGMMKHEDWSLVTMSDRSCLVDLIGSLGQGVHGRSWSPWLASFCSGIPWWHGPHWDEGHGGRACSFLGLRWVCRSEEGSQEAEAPAGLRGSAVRQRPCTLSTWEGLERWRWESRPFGSGEGRGAEEG